MFKASSRHVFKICLPDFFRRLEDVLEDEKLFAGFELKSGFAGKLVEILTLILSLQADRHALTLQICTVSLLDKGP